MVCVHTFRRCARASLHYLAICYSSVAVVAIWQSVALSLLLLLLHNMEKYVRCAIWNLRFTLLMTRLMMSAIVEAN